MKNKPQKKVWTMPAWMEQYREHIVNTGGNSIETLMNGNTDSFINLPLAILEVAVSSQVTLLKILHEKGKLP